MDATPLGQAYAPTYTIALHTLDLGHRFPELLDKTDEDLFNNMCRSQHCLHHLLPPLRSVDNLRERGHSFSLLDYNKYTQDIV